ncbi:MAG: dodecin domain-containing protein [Chloroflexi bacterium]|nr:dodecin domain-containing protein [Chloroflexota bacterium]
MAVIKVIELVGSSPNGWEEATKMAVAKAAETIHNIIGADLVGQTAVIKDNKLVEFRANVKIAFTVD